MEPFRITCITCQSKLVVRDPALVGSIMSCPKCSSMVQVVLPASSNEVSSAEASLANSETPSETGSKGVAAAAGALVALPEVIPEVTPPPIAETVGSFDLRHRGTD